VLVVLAEVAGEEDVEYTIREAGVTAKLVIVDVVYVCADGVADEFGNAEVVGELDEAGADEMATQYSS